MGFTVEDRLFCQSGSLPTATTLKVLHLAKKESRRLTAAKCTTYNISIFVIAAFSSINVPLFVGKHLKACSSIITVAVSQLLIKYPSSIVNTVVAEETYLAPELRYRYQRMFIHQFNIVIQVKSEFTQLRLLIFFCKPYRFPMTYRRKKCRFDVVSVFSLDKVMRSAFHHSVIGVIVLWNLG